MGEQSCGGVAWRVVADCASNAMVVLDPSSGRILEANRAAEALRGAPLAGEPFAVGAAAAAARELLAALPAGGARAYTWKTTHADGTPLSLDCDLRRDRFGEHERYVCVARDQMERQGAAARWSDSRARLRLATEAGGIGVWDLDLVHNTLVWDERMFELYGLAPGDFEGCYESWLGRVHPDDRARVAAAVDSSRRDGKSLTTSFRIVRPDGEIRHIRAYAKVIRDQQGQAVRRIGTNQDITAQVEREEAIAASEQRFKRLVANLPGAVYRRGIAGDFQSEFVSDGIKEICGYEPGQLCRNEVNWLDLVVAEDRTRLESALKEAIEQRGRFDAEFRIKARDGTERWIWERGSVRYSEAGAPEVLEGLVLDITERKKAVRALNNFFEQSAILHVITDMSGTIRRVNKEHVRMLGREKEELVGHNALEFVHPEDVEETKRVLGALARGEMVGDFENRCRRKDGTYRVLAWSVFASREDGAVYASAKEVDESKRAGRLAQATLDALSAHIAILNHQGEIIAVNHSWTAFAQSHGAAPRCGGAGANYLAVCDAATDADGARFAAGLRAVLAGEQAAFEMEYPCQTEEELLWFVARVTTFPAEDDRRVAVAHENITERKRAETARTEALREIKEHAASLERFNKAATGREIRMVELKKEINQLCVELGRDVPYVIFAIDETIDGFVG